MKKKAIYETGISELTLKGDVIESFERVEEIEEIILLGKNGGIRRIILEDE